MAGKKPRFEAHKKSFIAVEVLTKSEKNTKPFMRIEKGTKATASGGAKTPKEVEETEKEA
jgi:hypothetical protein